MISGIWKSGISTRKSTLQSNTVVYILYWNSKHPMPIRHCLINISWIRYQIIHVWQRNNRNMKHILNTSVTSILTWIINNISSVCVSVKISKTENYSKWKYLLRILFFLPTIKKKHQFGILCCFHLHGNLWLIYSNYIRLPTQEISDAFKQIANKLKKNSKFPMKH